jgi:K+/H+ antiporter YhaU regulatory subunit KhtT
MDYRTRHKYDYDPIEHIDKQYKKKTQYETEKIVRPNLRFSPKKHVDTEKIEYCEKVFRRDHKFELDIFQLEDYEFLNWANSQKATLIIAVMAEMKKSSKMKPEIESLRSQVKTIPLMSIEEYRKTKCLGDRSISFIRQMKHQYGNHVLRILYLTSRS